jgi:Mn-dependent DtxR family transcriptional regulator
MSDPKIADKQMKNLIIMTIETNGARWKKLDRILGFNDPMGQLKRVLEELEKSGYVYLKEKRYQLTKKGLEIYNALTAL